MVAPPPKKNVLDKWYTFIVAYHKGPFILDSRMFFSIKSSTVLLQPQYRFGTVQKYFQWLSTRSLPTTPSHKPEDDLILRHMVWLRESNEIELETTDVNGREQDLGRKVNASADFLKR